jgi:hypothetical protein
MAKFRVTYEIVTPESAEHGDADEIGFVYAGLGEFPLDKCDSPPEMSLRDAVELAGDKLEDAGHWFVQFDGWTNYATGAETRYSLHPPENITGASYARLSRLFGNSVH